MTGSVRVQAISRLAQWLLLGAAALAIAGCGKVEDQPAAALPPVAQGAPLTTAPAAQSLPPAPAIPVSAVSSPQAAYAFPDRAYEMSDTYGDAPPDYVYDYDGVQPWVWQSDDGARRVAEAVPGGERYYYYEAGADEPFYVQDPDYGYGYEDGHLIAVYDHSGRALPDTEITLRISIAARYWARAHMLYDASRQDRHLPVAEPNWMARRSMIDDQRQAWQQQMNQDPDWRAFHDQNAPAVEAHWQSERVQRLKWAAHVDETMHNQDFAARERQEAQRVAAQPQQPSSSPPHVTARGQHPPGPPPQHALPPRETQQPPAPNNFAQPPSRQPQTPPQQHAAPPVPTRGNDMGRENPPPRADGHDHANPPMQSGHPNPNSPRDNHPQQMPPLQHQPEPQPPHQQSPHQQSPQQPPQTPPRADEHSRQERGPGPAPGMAAPARGTAPSHQEDRTPPQPAAPAAQPQPVAPPRHEPPAPQPHATPARSEPHPGPAQQSGHEQPPQHPQTADHPHPEHPKDKDKPDDRQQHN